MSRSRVSRATVAALLVAGCLTAHAAGIGFKEAAQDRPLDAPGARTSLLVSASVAAWQSTGAMLRAGATYRVTAQGRWQIGPLCNPTGPDGLNPYTLLCWDSPNKQVPTASHSTLIARIGHSGPPFAIGSVNEFTAAQDGILYLMVNDAPGWFRDNTGQVSAEITVVAAAPRAGGAAPYAPPAQNAGRPQSSGATGAAPVLRGGGGGGGGGGSGGGGGGGVGGGGGTYTQ